MIRHPRGQRQSPLAGFAGTLLVHGMAAVLLFVGIEATPPMVQTYAVKLTAAPAPTARRRVAPEAVPRPVERTAPTKPETRKPTPTPPKPTPAKPTQRTEKAPPTNSTVEPLPGEQPSTGTSVANVDLKGRPFPYQEYLENIVAQILRNWDRPLTNAPLYTEVSFVILRDGTVREIAITRTSRNYGFDLSARGAVEAAGNVRAFGPLPSGFTEDALPITFYFKPRTTP